MQLLLITGAGASRNLSSDPDRPLPLMKDWAQQLCADIGSDLASATGLDKASTSERFEETLGALLRWESQLPLATRFAPLAGKPPRRNGQGHSRFIQGLRHAEKNMVELVSALHKSLFSEFGPRRVNKTAAVKAYDALVSEILTSDPPSALVCATTNYDRSLEMALEEMGEDIRSGFISHRFLPMKLQPEGLGDFDSERPALLYLHGAVGWYSRDGEITSHLAEDYTDALGVPAVLYPSLDKDIEKAETAGIWKEFERAVAAASHILVVGHALNDDHLVAVLRKAKCPVAVTIYPYGESGERVSWDGLDGLKQTQAVLRKLPDAHTIGMDFGPKLAYEEQAVEHWVRGLDRWRDAPVKPAMIRAA